jgi:ribonuclease Y
LDDRFKRIAAAQEGFDAQKAERAQLKAEAIARLAQQARADAQAIKAGLARELEDQFRVDAKKLEAAYEEDVRLRAEEYAKRILSVALSRFPRASCTERGIGTVEIPTDAARARLMGPGDANWKALERLVDVDLTINDHNVAQIGSYDPVKRELVTRCLEKLLNEKKVDEQAVQRILEKTKRDLGNRIEEDGRKVAAELGQGDLHPEIKRMLGSLRYRYSFAQNQHFHVAEVGWLCGLLAQELKSVAPRDARRAGLLHDVGKAMDHAIEGGHAVIGADFINERGEKEPIVHAVRAHHFEEQPASDLAFLVIAADAISGARPGARRSTVNVYNQKIEALSTIGDGFRGVTKTLVFNAGREVRILVDGHRVNDEQSLVLCRQIADKIEEECTYPGQIKVVVVRETHAEAMAK